MYLVIFLKGNTVYSAFQIYLTMGSLYSEHLFTLSISIEYILEMLITLLLGENIRLSGYLSDKILKPKETTCLT